jgi:hypothetical protein
MAEDLTPFQTAVVRILTTTTPIWQPFTDKDLTDIQEKALRRCILSGVVQCRLPITIWLPPSRKCINAIFTISGDYRLVVSQTLQSLGRSRAWKGPTLGVRRDPITHIRLNRHGVEAARELTTRPNFVFDFIGDSESTKAVEAEVSLESDSDGMLDGPDHKPAAANPKEGAPTPTAANGSKARLAPAVAKAWGEYLEAMRLNSQLLEGDADAIYRAAKALHPTIRPPETWWRYIRAAKALIRPSSPDDPD